MSNIRICTYNIRTDCSGDGVNAFPNRSLFIEKEFPKYQADLIGFQETRPHQRQWVIDHMKDMTVVGIGRDADLLGESNIIAYRTSRFDLVTLDTFWLSDTPHIPGSRFSTDQSDCPRICTCVMLRDKENGKCLRYYNTHLDHVGKFAQAQGISLILNRIAADYAVINAPVILTGDFNVQPDSEVRKSVLGFNGCGEKLIDVTADVGKTFHNYRPKEYGITIDYIFTNIPAVPGTAMTAKDECNGVFLSDHYPVLCDLKF